MRIPQDVRYSIRSLIRTPAFTFPAVASLALALAVNTTVFAIFNAVLLTPLPAADAHELVRIGRTQRGERQFRSVSYEEFAYLRQHARSVDVVGHQIDKVTLVTPESTEAISVEFSTGDYFAMLGVPPAVGRGFARTEDRVAGDAPVAVISDRLWRRRFDRNPSVVGRLLSLNDHPFTVIGVAPPRFHGTSRCRDRHLVAIAHGGCREASRRVAQPAFARLDRPPEKRRFNGHGAGGARRVVVAHE